MLIITNYKRNANQNHNEVSLHTSRNGYHQKSTDKAGKGEKGTYYIVDRNVNWYSHYGQKYRNSSKNRAWVYIWGKK